MATQTYDLSGVTELVHNGVNLGHSKLMLNGVRAWEKYLTTESYQEWVSSGYNQSSESWVTQAGSAVYATSSYSVGFIRTSGTIWVQADTRCGSGSKISIGGDDIFASPGSRGPEGLPNADTSIYRSGSLIKSMSSGYVCGWFKVYTAQKLVNVNTWIDTSGWVDKTRQVTAYYY